MAETGKNKIEEPILINVASNSRHPPEHYLKRITRILGAANSEGGRKVVLVAKIPSVEKAIIVSEKIREKLGVKSVVEIVGLKNVTEHRRKALGLKITLTAQSSTP